MTFTMSKSGLNSSSSLVSCSKSQIFIIISLQAILFSLIIYLSYSSSPLNRKIFNNSYISNETTNTSVSVFIEELIGINSFPNLITEFSVPHKSFSGIPRAVKEKDYVTLMKLVEYTTKFFEDNNISYVLTYGSLVGSFLMHDILPWDDDVDIFINNKTKAKVLKMVEKGLPYGIEGFHYHNSPGQIIKLYFKSSKKAGGYRWRWPFIDLLSYVDDKENIRAVEKRARVIVPKSSFYPFHKRPFGPLWLNAPKDPAVFLKAKYGKFRCKSGSWNHQHEKRQAGKSAPCTMLTKYYPFVKRTAFGNSTKEELILDEKSLYSIYIDEKPRHRKTMFEW